MTSTNQPDPAKDSTDSLPVEPKSKAPEEPRMVPLDAVVELRQKLREAKDEIASYRADLERLKAAPSQAAPQPHDESFRKDVEELKRDKTIRKLVGELGLTNDKQGEAVAKMLEDAPKLTPIEAISAAATRDPELFKDRRQSGFDSSIHGSLSPTKGSQPNTEPKKSDMQRRFELADAQTTSRRKNAIVNNLIGNMAAKVVGREHELFKLPD